MADVHDDIPCPECKTIMGSFDYGNRRECPLCETRLQWSYKAQDWIDNVPWVLETKLPRAKRIPTSDEIHAETCQADNCIECAKMGIIRR